MKKTYQLCTLFLVTLAVAGIPATAQSYEYDAAEPEVGVVSSEGSYSYLRVVEGSATLTQGDTGDREEARLHQPVLAGDRLWVSPDARLELVLSDYNRLRLDHGTEVVFDRLAASPDSRDAETSIRLLRGNLQLVVDDGYLGSDPPRLELPFATVFTRGPGSYRAECDAYGVCWVVVRNGSAEVLTDRGSLLVRPGEAAFLEQHGDLPQVSIETAKSWDDLERWGERLEIEARRADVRGVDESLRYAAAPLDDYGDWVDVDEGWAWRPRASADWRPYWRGSWRYTPSGLFWISDEPWGWVTHHYGTWDFHPYHGWVWYPSNVFAPARVYWYWGPQHVAWIPAGYYTRHYGPRYSGFSFHFGIHGYAGGSFHHFRDWTFCDLGFFRSHHRRRDFHRHLHRGHRLERAHRGDVVPRGIITTDTRGLSPDRWDDPQRTLRELADRRGTRRGTVPRLGDRGDLLPDVTPFVARQPDLPEPVRRRVVTSGSPDRPLRNAGVNRGSDDSPTRVRVQPRRPDRPVRNVGETGNPGERPKRVRVQPRQPDQPLRIGRSDERPTRVQVRSRQPDRPRDTGSRRPVTTQRPTRVERPTASSDRPTRNERPTTGVAPPRTAPAPRTVRPRTVEPWARDGDRPTRRPTASATPSRPSASPRTRPPSTSSERPLRRPTRPGASATPERRPTTSDRPLRSPRPSTSSRTPTRRPTSVRAPRSTRSPTTSRRPSTSSRRPTASSSRPQRTPSAGSSSSSPRSRPSARSSGSSSSKPSARSSSGRSTRSRSGARSRGSSGSRGKARSRRNGS